MALRPIQLCIVFTIGFHLATSQPQPPAIINQTQQRLSIELKDPKDVIVGKGQSASLTCAIQATDGNVELVWIYNGNRIPLNDSRWKLLDNGTLYIPKVTGKRMNSVEGLYQCLVKNKVGSLLSNTAKLSIASFSKEFQEQPVNKTVQEGRPVVLSCKIHSFPSGVVTWIQNNLTLPQIARYVPLPSGTLLITSTHSSDAGSYSCKVMNPILKNKARESDIGWLTVVPPPLDSSDAFATLPIFLPLGIRLNVTALVGENVNLYCAADGWPLPFVHWIKETNSIPLGNSSVLTLSNVTAETTGKYTCVAWNRLDTIKQTFFVEIQQAPYFNHTFPSKEFVPPVTLRMPCNPLGIPKPKVYWLKNGEPFNYSVRQRTQTSSLMISNSIVQDMGFYQCVAENSVGKTWIAAQYVPKDLVPDVLPPSAAKCRPYNDTSICVQWKDVEKAKVYVVYYFHEGSETEILSLTNFTYQMLENLNKSTNYTFYIRAFTLKVSDQSEHVTCKPGVSGERNLQIYLHNESTIELSWSQISTDIPCDESPSDYRVQWKRANQTYSNVEYVKQRSYYVCDLQPSTEYQFRVTSSTLRSENSRWSNFIMPANRNNRTELKKTDNETFITAPYNLKAEYRSSSSINLSWSHNSKNIDNFLICYIEAYSDKNCQVIYSKLDKFSVEGLHPSTAYEFKVCSKYDNGSLSYYSQAIEVSTLPEGPPTIQDLRFRALNSTSICLRWRAPSTINGTRIKYLVSYKNATDDIVGKTIDINTSQHCWLPPPSSEDIFQAQLTQLNPEMRYTVSITLENTSYSYSISVSTRKINTTTTDSKRQIYEQQKLGVILGIAISLCAIIGCISCLIYSIKKKQTNNTVPPTRVNYYNSGTNSVSTYTQLQLRYQEAGIADAQEVQTLIRENGICHIPSVTPSDLDTKGGIDFPNRQANGSLDHHNKTVYIPNGHVHITENPQFCGHNQHRENDPILHQTQESSYEEDSNSNLQNIKLRKLFLQKPEHIEKRKSGTSAELKNSVSSSVESSLDVTQLTTLDDSGITPIACRKVSVPLGPNG